MKCDRYDHTILLHFTSIFQKIHSKTIFFASFESFSFVLHFHGSFKRICNSNFLRVISPIIVILFCWIIFNEFFLESWIEKFRNVIRQLSIFINFPETLKNGRWNDWRYRFAAGKFAMWRRNWWKLLNLVKICLKLILPILL